MKKCVSRIILSPSLLQAASLMAKPLQYFEIERKGGGNVHGQIVYSSSQQPKLKILACNFTPMQFSVEITDSGLHNLAASILRGEYRIADEQTPTSSPPTGTWLSARYTAEGIQGPVEIRRPLLIKGNHVTDAVRVLEDAIRSACITHTHHLPE